MAMGWLRQKTGLPHTELALGSLKGEGRKLQRVREQEQKSQALARALPLTSDNQSLFL